MRATVKHRTVRRKRREAPSSSGEEDSEPTERSSSDSWDTEDEAELSEIDGDNNGAAADNAAVLSFAEVFGNSWQAVEWFCGNRLKDCAGLAPAGGARNKQATASYVAAQGIPTANFREAMEEHASLGGSNRRPVRGCRVSAA
jgi:hypothetical protein